MLNIMIKHSTTWASVFNHNYLDQIKYFIHGIIIIAIINQKILFYQFQEKKEHSSKCYQYSAQITCDMLLSSSFLKVSPMK